MAVVLLCAGLVIGAATFTWAKDAKDGVNR